MSKSGIQSSQQFRKLYSYKEERVKSSKKLDLNLTIANQSDIDQISSEIKNNISRRMSQSSSGGAMRIQT